jgi:hypothetical protein
MTRAFIKDGYNAKFFIKERFGLHEDVRGEFRRILPEERATFIDSVSKTNDGAKMQRITAAALAKTLTKWDLRDGKGEAVEITGTNLLHCEFALLDRLAAIVLYRMEGGDVDPLWTDGEKKEHDETDSISALAGKPFGDALDEGDSKN